jgi:hypothetical protein
VVEVRCRAAAGVDFLGQSNWIEAIYGQDVLSSDFDVPVQTAV